MIRYARDSSVGTATRYGLDGPGIESLWGRYFPHPSRPALGPTHLPIQWVPGLYRVVKPPERGVDHPPTPSSEVKEGVELYISTFGTSWPFIGRSLPLPSLIRDPVSVGAGYIDLMFPFLENPL